MIRLGRHHRYRRRDWPLERLDERTLLSTFVVSNLADQGSGTLRAAIDQANLFPGSTIKFSVRGAIILSSALSDVSADVTIIGPGAAGLTVERNGDAGTPLFSIFAVDPGVTASISGLAIADGAAVYGGGIFNAGTLIVNQCTFTDDSATHGGGIFNSSRLAIGGSTFLGDSATYIDGAAAAADDAAADDAAGKAAQAEAEVQAVYNPDPNDVDDLVRAAQAAAQAAAVPAIYSGGAIANYGTLTVTRSILSDNSAVTAGAIANYGTMTVDGDTVSGNSAINAGGIGNAGTLTLAKSALSGNAAAYGGGIANVGQLTVTTSIISQNSVNGLGGGGIDNFGTLTVTNSTLSGNSATMNNNGSGGGIVNFGTLTVANSTLSGNSASVTGGGIDNFGTLMVTNTTLSENTAAQAAGIGNHGTFIVTSSAPSASSGVADGTGSVGGPFNNSSATVVPQSLASSVTVVASNSGTASVGPGAASASPGGASTSPGAPPSGPGASPAASGVPSADTDVLFSEPVGASADTARTMPASAALSAAIVALDSASGASDARLVPLRESTLALVGTLLVVTLESTADDTVQTSSALETSAALLVGPGSTIAMNWSLPSPTDLGRMGGRDTEPDDVTGADANPAPHGPIPWEHFVIGLDREFDRFRRAFREPARDEPTSKRANLDAASPDDHLRATDAVLSTGWSEDATFSLPVPPGDESRVHPTDPEGTTPLQVSLSGVVVALTAGYAWARLRRRPRSEIVRSAEQTLR